MCFQITSKRKKCCYCILYTSPQDLVTSGLKFSFHPFFSPSSTPFHEGWIKKHCWISLLSKSCRPWSRFVFVRWVHNSLHAWSTDQLSISAFFPWHGGVMQAPSAVESEMSCWPVYICLCSNYCILKCGSIQQRKGTQWTQCIAARLIKTALNIKLKNKTLKDIELAP